MLFRSDKQAEYIRDGLNMFSWRYNMGKLMSSGKLRGLHVMCTINALCLETLPEFLDLLIGWKKVYGRNFPNFSLNILRFPSFQSVLVLPIAIRKHHADRLSQFLVKHKGYNYLHEHEINQTQRLIKYLLESPAPTGVDQLQHDFKKFYNQYDQRRGKDFTATFDSTMNEWYATL